jgi:hypothetical protein
VQQSSYVGVDLGTRLRVREIIAALISLVLIGAAPQPRTCGQKLFIAEMVRPAPTVAEYPGGVMQQIRARLLSPARPGTTALPDRPR